jgi:glycosyltransferase involved in cell wall biosynthesis
MRVLHLLSCRGWSSDAYWAARIARELARRGHEVTLGCRDGTEERVIARARAEGVDRITTFAFAGGLRPDADFGDVRRLRAAVAEADVIHVHRGKEHWLAAVANRLCRTPRPIIRTRHIVQAVRPHAGNRWLYQRATALVVTVTHAIRDQYLASGLLPASRVVALPGGADLKACPARPGTPDARRRLGGAPDNPLLGMVSGLRVMKGHGVVIEAAARLAAEGLRPRFAFVGRGSQETAIRNAIDRAGLGDQIMIAGFAEDLPAALAALDVALYVPVESEGMSRVVFEYMAAARPLIASRVGVVPEILNDGEHAVLVPGGDPDALAAAIARLLRNAPLRARLGESARRLLADRFSGARVAEALESHYDRLLSFASR